MSSHLTQSMERLAVGIAMFEGQIARSQQQLAEYEAYDLVLNQMNGQRPAPIIAAHDRWLKSELRRARWELRQAEKRLMPLKQEHARLEAIALDKMKVGLTGKTTPVATTTIKVGPESTARRQDRKPRGQQTSRRERPEPDGEDMEENGRGKGRRQGQRRARQHQS